MAAHRIIKRVLVESLRTWSPGNVNGFVRFSRTRCGQVKWTRKGKRKWKSQNEEWRRGNGFVGKVKLLLDESSSHEDDVEEEEEQMRGPAKNCQELESKSWMVYFQTFPVSDELCRPNHLGLRFFSLSIPLYLPIAGLCRRILRQ